MTKPITAAAVMILYDRGLFKLEDKLSDYIPEFAHPTVLMSDGREVPAESEITIRQTLDMTSGLCYPDQSYPAGRKMDEVYSEIARESDAGKRVGTLELIRREKPSGVSAGRKVDVRHRRGCCGRAGRSADGYELPRISEKRDI